MRLKSFSIFIIELAASKIVIAKSPRTTVIQTLQKQSYAILKFKFSIWSIKFTAILPQMEAMAQTTETFPNSFKIMFLWTGQFQFQISIAIKIFSTQSEFRFGRTTEQTAINNWQIHHSEDSKFRFGRTTDRQPVSLQNNHLAPAIINPPPLPLPLINHHYQRHFSQNRSIQQRCHA